MLMVGDAHPTRLNMYSAIENRRGNGKRTGNRAHKSNCNCPPISCAVVEDSCQSGEKPSTLIVCIYPLSRPSDCKSCFGLFTLACNRIRRRDYSIKEAKIMGIGIWQIGIILFISTIWIYGRILNKAGRPEDIKRYKAYKAGRP